MDITEFLARFWLVVEHARDDEIQRPEIEALAAQLGLPIAQGVVDKAPKTIRGIDGAMDVSGWIATLCFIGHPVQIWNSMLYAVAAAEERDLNLIATNLVVHLLAHYGSLMDNFEAAALADTKFHRMLTGVWRHGTCDAAWHRVRGL